MQIRSAVDAVASVVPAGGLALPPSPNLGEAAWLPEAGDWLSLRFRQEVAWLEALPGLGRAAARLLAAHAAGDLLAMRPQSGPNHSLLADICAGLAGVRPARPVLDTAFAALAEEGGVLVEPTYACVEALWPLAAPTEQLLVSGGDDRLSLGPTGRNKYGCTPWPRPEVIGFSSCTASSLSEGAFAAAERVRRQLLEAALATSPATALAEASEAIGAALLAHFGVTDLAEAVLAASGTDAALVVTGLLAAERPGERMTSVLVSPSETGSGVPDAVQGRHFACCAPSGRPVGKGEPIDGFPPGPALMTVTLRDGLGLPLPAAEVDAACEAAVRSGVAQGRVVLHAMDGSKTGLTAPGRPACVRLAGIFGDRLDIVIDACQGRIEPAMVRWYLAQGFPVLITGSKFFGAPGFCGAVLFPRARLERIAKAGRLPAGLAAYARLQGGFGSRRCPGLVLRWTAALHEMTAFGVLPAREVRERLQRMGRQIRTALAADARLRLMPAPRPAGMGWSDKRSVFTFAVRGPQGFLGVAALRAFYEALGEGKPACSIGQPVQLGGSDFGGLRLAVSAAQVVAGEDLDAGLGVTIGKLRGLM